MILSDMDTSPDTVNDPNVPTDVMFVCAAVCSVPVRSVAVILSIPLILVEVSPTISPLAVISPDTVNDPNVPTLVSEDPVTPVPSVVALKTEVLLILYSFPDAKFKFSEDPKLSPVASKLNVLFPSPDTIVFAQSEGAATPPDGSPASWRHPDSGEHCHTSA